ncbi:PLP-dependent aminotransferase family protein [Paraburkholderia sp. MMS20-SJTN17]|uniref:PLP-dependent aminotransferase family protein n=1 Tax=Paraburkholderia translucens TaxID=2886945 RepID=A0ABS8KLF8_9BURK|nr:PLP-dependent aminotransferase family protein [Paraburkholderia sp. MMS20-SJTN17]MCC8405581.1 PLP-dependent aminotransferase family protein [Paraburkholderia sp. MMS20-SJTN17]
MKPVLTLDSKSDTPLTVQIVAGVMNEVAEKRWRAGARVPSIRAFAAAHGVSTFTVVDAYDRLVAQGVLEARRGSGFYVSDRCHSAPRKVAENLDERVTNGWLLRNFLGANEGAIYAGAGWLPEPWFDSDGLARALRQLALQPESLLGYGHARGYEPLREQIARQLSDYEIEVDVGGVMTTLGANQSLDLVIRQFTQPGDTVMVDEPCYSDLLVALRLRDVESIGIPMTPTGPDTYVMETVLETRRPKVYFTNSRLHNPTGASYSSATAFKLLKAAERYNCVIVEDDVSADLVQGSHVTLASMDQLKHVIYIGSFSKTIGAGLRVGFVVAEAGILEGLLYQKLVSGMSTPTVTERLVSAILVEGHFRKQTEQLRDRLATAQERVCRRLEAIGFEIFCEPGAGMFVWARPAGVELDSAELAERALDKQILLAPGHLFYGGRVKTGWLRFNVAHSNFDRLFTFLAESVAP